MKCGYEDEGHETDGNVPQYTQKKKKEGLKHGMKETSTEEKL